MSERPSEQPVVNLKYDGKDKTFIVESISGKGVTEGILPTHNVIYKVKLTDPEDVKNIINIAEFSVIQTPIMTDYGFEFPIGIHVELLSPSRIDKLWFTLKEKYPKFLKKQIADGIVTSEEILRIFAQKKFMETYWPNPDMSDEDRAINAAVLSFTRPHGEGLRTSVILEHIPIFVDMEDTSSSPSAKNILEMAIEGQYKNFEVDRDEFGMHIDRYENGHSIVKGKLS